jgi:hypothetical protein
MSESNHRQKTAVDIFWGEIAPCDNVLQVYDTDEQFLSSLTGFVCAGINAGYCTIVIATQSHLDILDARLETMDMHPRYLKEADIFIPLNAEDTLARFMVNGWPDKQLFQHTIGSILERASIHKRRVRAFGEMVAILWAQGNHGATVALEALWNGFMKKEAFSLFCAYPKAGFTTDLKKSIETTCPCHIKQVRQAALPICNTMPRYNVITHTPGNRQIL